VDTATQVLGTKLASPILVSPSAAQAALHPDGENAMHQGATAAAGTPMIISNVSSFPTAKVVAAAAGPCWFQLYPRRDIESNRATLDEAQAAGCKAVVVTVDQQASFFERAAHDRNLGTTGGPVRRSTRGVSTNAYRIEEGRLWYTWKLFDELRPMVKVPMAIKGVLTPEDARLAIEHGLDAVYVSNHGGRALDYSPSTLEVLPEIVDAVAGRVPVLFDSGVRRGADVLKALALGAKAVCLGRIPRWGLAAYGAPGVQRIIEIMQAELAQAMAACGRTNIASIDRSIVRTDFP
jgi:isopentenyl diphosphate isomerase/L-lactate dehydrogenase-like FMN-dependent dehydrogenase